MKILFYHSHPTHRYINYSYLLPWSNYLLKMRFIVFLLLIVGCWCDVRVLVDQSGGYNITINNKLWLRSSRTAIYVDDRWYSTENQSLPLASITFEEGTDPNLGNWNETKLTYNLVRNQTSTSIIAHIREWSIVSAVTFHLETGDKALTNKISLDMEQVRTVFPSFNIEQTDMNDQRGFFSFGGKIFFSFYYNLILKH